MKKIALLFFILVSYVYGYTYNKLLLKAQASIFPKIIMLDKKLYEKLVDGKIVYTIVYEKNDYYTASEIGRFIEANYKNASTKYAYKINLVEFSEFSSETEATAIYVLNSNNQVQELVDYAKKKGIITFAYDINYLKSGFLFSLMLEKSAVIYLNKDNLNSNKIDFVDSLYQIVNFLDKSSG
ncbi:hypothetical protein [Sulfurimonas sp.]|jgi:hypothetical protein|uniref:hypothetical protein n=1 Tax=Sulfurimonas sp. TaxID=2022749 RepID=UPI0025D2AD01|nr:hypothetical protein [Sulfurimonas sp.]MCK9473567.1 hypothetical protein [Sulfurimonas sp.]MDD3505481.1 hypothetical protein [Sulfurimonas sp.]